ncbi:phage tail protein [Lacticaseibacillus saniviri]|uniref:phage tail protein n=1 Tax=Lacticaseibacillus saniviri TaxID=931533 RepID=UPI001EE0A76F|nr:phage tail protein [Lacticaseibacillus saniviri]MCG4280862.1 phage tail protein [Lacticaseibacillus saniviri]
MYRVTIRQSFDGEETVIHSNQANELKLLDAQVIQDVAAVDTFQFSIYPNNPGYNVIQYLQTFLRVTDTRKHRVIFDGRVFDMSEPLGEDGDLHKEIMAEDFLAVLHDSISDFKEFAGYTKTQLFRALIEMHNRQVEDYKQLKIGQVAFKDDSPVTYAFADDGRDTYDNITELLITPYGGELQVRHEADGLWVDCLPQISDHGNQKIELTKNLLQMTRKVDPSQLVTVLKPLGKAIDGSNSGSGSGGSSGSSSGYFDETGYWHEGSSGSGSGGYFDETGYWHESNGSSAPPSQENNDPQSEQRGIPRVTISTVNNGSPYLRDEAKIALYGVQIKSKSFDDEQDPAKLKQRGQEWLDSQETDVITTFQLNAVDLSLVDVDVDDLRNGWIYRTQVPVMHVDRDFRIVQQTIDLNDLSQTTIVIGDRIVGAESSNNSGRGTSLNNQLANQGAQLDSHSNEIDTLKKANEDLQKKYDDVVKRLGALEGSSS